MAVVAAAVGEVAAVMAEAGGKAEAIRKADANRAPPVGGVNLAEGVPIHGVTRTLVIAQPPDEVQRAQGARPFLHPRVVGYIYYMWLTVRNLVHITHVSTLITPTHQRRTGTGPSRERKRNPSHVQILLLLAPEGPVVALGAVEAAAGTAKDARKGGDRLAVGLARPYR